MVVKMFLDDVGVTVAMITVTLVAAVIVLLKVFLFQVEVTNEKFQNYMESSHSYRKTTLVA